jgi:hypothetical protein
VTNATSTLNRALYAAGVALFLAAPMSLAQFSLTWDFTNGTGTAVTGGGTGAYISDTVVDVGSVASYLTTPATPANISWNPHASALTDPVGFGVAYPGATDAWLFAGTAAGGPSESWMQAPGTPNIGGTAANPTWGDGTLGSASYLRINLPFDNFAGAVSLDSMVVEGGAHGQNTSAGPEVWGVYLGGGSLLASYYTDWGSAIPPAQSGGTIIDPWGYSTDSPAVVSMGTSYGVTSGEDLSLLFFAGFTGATGGPLVLDNLTLNFTLTAGPPPPPPRAGGGINGRNNGANGTPEPAGALLGLLTLGMVSFRRKRRS